MQGREGKQLRTAVSGRWGLADSGQTGLKDKQAENPGRGRFTARCWHLESQKRDAINRRVKKGLKPDPEKYQLLRGKEPSEETERTRKPESMTSPKTSKERALNRGAH